MTLHTVLFNVLANCFCWLIVVHIHLNTFCVLCAQSKPNKKRDTIKPTTKKLAVFHKQFEIVPLTISEFAEYSNSLLVLLSLYHRYCG